MAQRKVLNVFAPNRVIYIHKVTLTFHPVFGPPFTLYPQSFSGICKVGKFHYISIWNDKTQHLMHKVISQYEMMKLSIKCTRFKTNCSSSSSCKGRSTENICTQQALRKKKDRIKLSSPPKLMVFWALSFLFLFVLFWSLFKKIKIEC